METSKLTALDLASRCSRFLPLPLPLKSPLVLFAWLKSLADVSTDGCDDLGEPASYIGLGIVFAKLKCIGAGMELTTTEPMSEVDGAATTGAVGSIKLLPTELTLLDPITIELMAVFDTTGAGVAVEMFVKVDLAAEKLIDKDPEAAFAENNLFFVGREGEHW